MLSRYCTNLFIARTCAAPQLNNRNNFLTKALRRPSAYHRIEYGGMCLDSSFDFFGKDLLTTASDAGRVSTEQFERPICRYTGSITRNCVPGALNPRKCCLGLGLVA